MKLVITQTGTTPLQFEKELQGRFNQLKSSIAELGSAAATHMRTIIREQKHRGQGTGKLENSIENESIGDGWGVGVGKISDMNIRAPYWYVVNYGGWAVPAGTVIWGHYGQQSQPNIAMAGTGVGREPFVMGGFPLFKMTVRHPIYAMNYIEKTVNWLSSIWKIQIIKATKLGSFNPFK